MILLLCLLLEGVVFQTDALRTRGLVPLPLDASSARISLEELPQEDSDVTAVMPSSQTRDPVFRTTMVFENLELENIHTLLFLLVSLKDDVPFPLHKTRLHWKMAFVAESPSPGNLGLSDEQKHLPIIF